MFERFTERARQVVVHAQDESRALKHNYIGTEHLLLGLLREEEGLAAQVLDAHGMTVEELRAQVARIVGEGDEVTHGQIPFTPRAKRVLELSLCEAARLGHNYVGTEHVLLGLAREDDGLAAMMLLDYGLDGDAIRAAVEGVLRGGKVEVGMPRGLTPSEREAGAGESELAAELERIRGEKADAIEADEFERAARLRDEERRLRRRLLPQARV